MSAQGPAGLSFNEFNPLFNRNRIAFQGSGITGENDTWGGEAVVSAIYKKLSLSAGYSHFETDGWYKNADQDDDIYNVFAQYELSYKTSIQAEYRYRDTDKGDVSLNFFEDNALPFLRNEDKVTSGRLGFRHAFTQSSILIGNFQYSDADRDQSDLFFFDPDDFGLPPPPIEDFTDDKGDDDAYSGELSYMFRSHYLDVVSGTGAFKIDQDIQFTDSLYWPGLEPPLFFGTFPSKLNLEVEHYNLYLYSYIKPLKNLTLTVGASGDFYDADDKDVNEQDIDEDQFNPKFGITWSPFDGTTVRGAVFRTFKRTLITDQTLEPTQVAGINQFYDDFNATDAWVYGAAVDQKFTQNIYAGAEFTYRDLDVPYFSGFAPTLEAKEADWDEYLGRAYLYWTPHEWLALRAEYGYEKFEFDEKLNFGAENVKTHSFPLGVNFFHPSGLSAGLKVTYYDQEGDFERFDSGVIQSADDTFWLVDAAISYRLPKRYGFISFGVTNLFDQEFEYFEVDLKNSRIQPERQVLFKVTLAFP